MILYDGPDATDMSFEFGADRALAESAYRTFAALAERGAGQAAWTPEGNTPVDL